MGGNEKVEGKRSVPAHPELWADRSPPGRKTVPVRVHCETKTNGERDCRVVDMSIWDSLFGNRDDDAAVESVIRFLNFRTARKPEKRKEAGEMQSPFLAGSVAISVPYTGTFPWTATGAVVATELTGAAAFGAAVAPPLIGAAVFGPSQTAFEEQNRLINFAVAEEQDITINVVVDNVNPARPVERALERRSGGGGNGQRPPNRYRSWKELYEDAKEFLGQLYRFVRRDRRFQRFKEWFRSRYSRKEAAPVEKFERPEGVGRFKWALQRIKDSFKDYFRAQTMTIQKNAVGTARCIGDYVRHPLGQTLDVMNRPGRLAVLVSDIYGLARLITAIFRRAAGSKETDPLGSGLIPEKAKSVLEPVIGIAGSAALGGMIEHHIFGWGRAAAFVFEGVFAAGSVMLQKSSGGAMNTTIDTTRLDLSTATTALIWGPVAVYNKVARTAFASRPFPEFIESLARNGHMVAADALKAVPKFLAPEVVPSFESILAYWGLMTTHTYLVLPIDVWSDGENAKEYAKSITTKLFTYLLATRWFDLAFSTYTRPVISFISAVAEINLSAKFSEYYKIYKGKKFYRETLHELASSNALPGEALFRINSALCSNSLGRYWELEDQDWYDFYVDLHSGEFSPAEVDYFRRLSMEKDIAPEYERVREGLRLIFRDENTAKKDFFKSIEDINSGLYDSRNFNDIKGFSRKGLG